MRKHLPLIVGFAIPVLLVVAVTLSIYLPRVYTDAPKSDFLFMSRPDYSYPYAAPYGIEDKSLIARPPDQRDLYDYQLQGNRLVLVKSTERGFEMNRLPTVYYYNVATNAYTAIDSARIGDYAVANTKTSPDGFEITSGRGGGGIFELFSGGSDYNSTYISKGSYSKKLNLPTGSYINTNYCYGLTDCGFVGWVVGGSGK